MSVDVINLLALPDKNKDIINVMKSSLYINFDQTVTTWHRGGGELFVPLNEIQLLGKEMSLGLIIRLWLRFMSHHLVLWLLGTYDLRESE